MSQVVIAQVVLDLLPDCAHVWRRRLRPLCLWLIGCGCRLNSDCDLRCGIWLICDLRCSLWLSCLGCRLRRRLSLRLLALHCIIHRHGLDEQAQCDGTMLATAHV